MLKCSNLNGDTIGFYKLMFLQAHKLKKMFQVFEIALTVKGLHVRTVLLTFLAYYSVTYHFSG